MFNEHQNELERQNASPQEKFQQKFDAVLERPLTATNIDSYADDALEDLIELTAEATVQYDRNPTIVGSDSKHNEDNAFLYLGLPNVDSTLDYIQEKSKELTKIDSIIQRAPIIDRVIIPPSTRNPDIEKGDEESEPHEHTARLKTLLFVLSNEFNIDIDDPEKVSLKRGLVVPGMMRGASYYTVDIFDLKRTVMVCDARGNATFVFNQEKMEEADITSDDIMGLNKPDIEDLMKMSPDLGKKIRYSNRFVPNMIRELSEPDVEVGDEVSYLMPKAPEGYLHTRAIAKLFGVSSPSINKAVDEIGPAFGEIRKFRFLKQAIPGYSPEQQELIFRQLDLRGNFAETMPDGFRSATSLSKYWRISGKTVTQAVDYLGESLGELKKYKINNALSVGLSPEQQEIVKKYLEEKGLFTNKPPEGYRSFSSLKQLWGLASSTIKRAIKEVGSEELGELAIMRGPAKKALHFSPEQQEILHNYLTENGYFNNAPPDGYLPNYLVADSLGVSNYTVVRAAKRLGSSLGDVGQYKTSTIVTACFSPDQQEMIRLELEREGLYGERMPEGYSSFTGIAKSLGVNPLSVRQAIEDIGEKLGEIQGYRFKGSAYKIYSPTQQGQIKEYLKEAGKLAAMAPEGYVSVSKFSRQLGSSIGTLYNVAAGIDDIGPIENFKFTTSTAHGLSPEQQDKIKAEFDRLARLNSQIRDNVDSIPSAANKLGISDYRLRKIIKGMAGSIGELKTFRFGSTMTQGVDEEQQKIIREHLDNTPKA